MVGYIEASPKELKQLKKLYGNGYDKHAISRISADPEEAQQNLKCYFCPCCGLVYDWSNDVNAQKQFDEKQKDHIKSCSRSFGDDYYNRGV